MPKEVTARARIQVVIEIGDNGPYGKGWTIDQIEKDATEASMRKLTEVLRPHRGQIVGEPKCIVIMTRDADG